MSKLIIVCNEEHADKIVPSNFELDFAKKIPVYGKLYISNCCVFLICVAIFWLMISLNKIFSSFFIYNSLNFLSNKLHQNS
jgi:hypothetical protein